MIDAIFTAGSVCFAFALLPAVRNRDHKPPISTSALTAFWLWVFAGCYVALGLTFSSISTAVTAGLWTTLGVQEWLQRN